MIAGSNESGKSTLAGLLRRDYAVNFYTMLNADDILDEVSKTYAYLPALSVDGELLSRYVRQSEYAPQTKAYFENGDIFAASDAIRFRTGDAVNTYTVALLTNFLQNEHISTGRSFSQETVFSHPSKPEEKVVARSMRSLGNVGAALPFCSRAFFFDNSTQEMRFLAEV